MLSHTRENGHPPKGAGPLHPSGHGANGWPPIRIGQDRRRARAYRGVLWEEDTPRLGPGDAGCIGPGESTKEGRAVGGWRGPAMWVRRVYGTLNSLPTPRYKKGRGVCCQDPSPGGMVAEGRKSLERRSRRPSLGVYAEYWMRTSEETPLGTWVNKALVLRPNTGRSSASPRFGGHQNIG
jgi:hypothetical protein